MSQINLFLGHPAQRVPTAGVSGKLKIRFLEALKCNSSDILCFNFESIFFSPYFFPFYFNYTQAYTFLARPDFRKPSSRLAYNLSDYAKPRTCENVSAEMKLGCLSFSVLDNLCGTVSTL